MHEQARSFLHAGGREQLDWAREWRVKLALEMDKIG